MSWQADHHAGGPGKIHHVNEGSDSTICGWPLEKIGGQLTSNELTCKNCIRKVVTNQIDLLPGLAEAVEIEKRATAIGVEWGTRMRASPRAGRPWDMARAREFAIRKVIDLHEDDRVRGRLARLCLDAAFKEYER